jgi:hypothetical protein
MEQLESKGKLRMDTPEEEAYWEKRLEEERAKHQSWKRDENESYLKQKKMDLDFLRKKGQANTTPIANESQDPAKNPLLNPVVPEEQQPIPTGEPTETETAQAAFVPKPPPDKEAPVTAPRMKAIEVDGKEVYNAGKEVKKAMVSDIEGMPEESAKRLRDHGIATEEDFKRMDRAQAKSLLGEALYRRFEKLFTP